jgi:hypothetical protein
MLVTRTLPCAPHEPGLPEMSFVYVPREPSSAGQFARHQPGRTLLPGNQTAQNCTPRARPGHIQQTKRALGVPARPSAKHTRGRRIHNTCFVPRDFEQGQLGRTLRLFGWHILAYLGLSWLICSHIILFILPAEHYSFYQPNTLLTLVLPYWLEGDVVLSMPGLFLRLFLASLPLHERRRGVKVIVLKNDLLLFPS